MQIQAVREFACQRDERKAAVSRSLHIRRTFVPDEGQKGAEADFKRQEEIAITQEMCGRAFSVAS